MATRNWVGMGIAVAQVSKVTFGTYDASTTRSMTIGGISVSATDSGGNLTAALTAFAVVLNASTHPYFNKMTWSSTATEIIATTDAAYAGMPFVMTGSVSGGTGTVSGGGVMTTTTANAGPNDWSTLANWSGQTLPVDGDTVIFKDNEINVCWNLDQSAIELALLRIDKTYTGTIGLCRDFAEAADGTSNITTAVEYRDQYLIIGPVKCEIGQSFSASSAAGSGRIKLDFGTDACTCVIFDTAASPSDTGQTAVQLKANESTTDIFVRSAPGGVGIAIGPGEVTTIRKVSISDITTASRVYCGPGTTLTTWEQTGGDNLISPAATVTTITSNGGNLEIEGAAAITTLNCYDGTVYPNSTGTITALNINGTSATVDMTQSTQARTVTTPTLSKGTFKFDPTVVTLTNNVETPSAKVTWTAA